MEKTILAWFDRIANALVTFCKWFGMIALLIMVTMITVSTLGRYLINHSVTGVDELAEYMLLIISLYGGVLALRVNAHMAVDSVINRLRPAVRRWLTVATDVSSIVFCIFMVLATWQITYLSLVSNAKSLTTLMLPLAPIQVLMPIGFLLLAIEFTHQITLSLRKKALTPLESSQTARTT